jgi:membrane-bound inhibitor of C-type lysozyme
MGLRSIKGLQRRRRMGSTWTRLLAGVGVVLLSVSMGATDLKIQVNGKQKQEAVLYQCDGKGKKIGLPGGVFQVKYIAGGGNSLAVIPVNKNSVIFARVVSAYGAKYAAKTFTWQQEGRNGATFSSDLPTGTVRSSCSVTYQLLAPAPEPLSQPY